MLFRSESAPTPTWLPKADGEDLDTDVNAEGGIRPWFGGVGNDVLLDEESLDQSDGMVESLETSKGCCAVTLVC